MKKRKLFPGFIAGILLAAIIAASMSTADSQLLVASSSFTSDIYKPVFRKKASDKEVVWIGRATILVVAVVAYFIASAKGSGAQAIMDMVENAWGGFGASFGASAALGISALGTSAFGVSALGISAFGASALGATGAVVLANPGRGKPAGAGAAFRVSAGFGASGAFGSAAFGASGGITDFTGSVFGAAGAVVLANPGRGKPEGAGAAFGASAAGFGASGAFGSAALGAAGGMIDFTGSDFGAAGTSALGASLGMIDFCGASAFVNLVGVPPNL